MQVVEEPELRRSYLLPEGRRARIEQVVLLAVAAWDINCPQHIPHKLDAAEVGELVTTLRARIAELERALSSRR